MKIKLLAIGKTDALDLQSLIETYESRLKHYIGFKLEVIPDIKNVKNLYEISIKNVIIPFKNFLQCSLFLRI